MAAAASVTVTVTGLETVTVRTQDSQEPLGRDIAEAIGLLPRAAAVQDHSAAIEVVQAPQEPPPEARSMVVTADHPTERAAVPQPQVRAPSVAPEELHRPGQPKQLEQVLVRLRRLDLARVVPAEVRAVRDLLQALELEALALRARGHEVPDRVHVQAAVNRSTPIPAKTRRAANNQSPLSRTDRKTDRACSRSVFLSTIGMFDI